MGQTLRPLIIGVQAMLDLGAHSIRKRRAANAPPVEFVSMFVCWKGLICGSKDNSEIPSKFLARGMINLFVTDTLGYDIDRDRTGGCLMGPLPPGRRSGGDERLLALATAPRCFDSGLPCLRRFGVGQVILTILKIDIHEVVGRDSSADGRRPRRPIGARIWLISLQTWRSAPRILQHYRYWENYAALG